ncbi:MAG TPA: CCA tRNA nucleotidyltransferase, partial [Candidatus Limosilactobacillus merdipullorum]|nr:CCA tRNA nucleotidyltransferase [Candidatus Limosilactobacillus merdipullorum]
TGADLIKDGVMTPGPQLGKALKWVEAAVVNQELANDYDQIISAIKQRKGEF